MAFVVLTMDAASKYKHETTDFVQSLIRYAKERLPGFARPEWVEVVQELPKTSTGKIQKNVLRDKIKKQLAKL